MTLPVLPEWATDSEALVEEPTAEKQAQGWTTDTNTPEGIGEKPPLEYFNWLARQTYLSLSALYTIVGDITSLGTMAAQNSNSVAITGGTIAGTEISAGSIEGAEISGGSLDNCAIGSSTPSSAIFTTARDSGAPPTLPSQLTNRGYVDAAFTSGNIALPGGLIFKYGSANIPAGNITHTSTSGVYFISAETTVTFPVAFPTAALFCGVITTQWPISSGGDDSWATGSQIKAQSASAVSFHMSGLPVSSSPPDENWIIQWWAVGH
jgi:hypothetical protein